MDSEIFIKTPPLKLFFQCAVPAAVTSVFEALYSVVDGIILAPAFGLNGIWFDFTAASVLSGLLTLIMAKTMKI